MSTRINKNHNELTSAGTVFDQGLNGRVRAGMGMGQGWYAGGTWRAGVRAGLNGCVRAGERECQVSKCVWLLEAWHSVSAG